MNGRARLRISPSMQGAWADLFWERSERLRLVLDDGSLEDTTGGVEEGVGIRVIAGDQTYYTSQSVRHAADVIAAAAEVGAHVTEVNRRLSTTVFAASADRFTIAGEPSGVPLARKTELLRRADRAAREVSTDVTQVTVTYNECVQHVAIANSDGLCCADRRVRLDCVIAIVAAAGGRLESTSETLSWTGSLDRLEGGALEVAARVAATRALTLLDAEPVSPGVYPVVIASEAGGTLVHESVGHGLEADGTIDGLSPYAGRLGEVVASELITVIDDGTDPGQRGTAAIDDEGTRTQRTVLIENGVLRAYLTDRAHAAKLGTPSSGNGRRESFRYLPICRMTNTMIRPGVSDPGAIVRSVGEGLFVRRMGGGEVDLSTGTVAFQMTECYRLSNGRVGHPVRGATLIGHGPTLMRQIDMVGWDLGYAGGLCGKHDQIAPVSHAQPTLRLPEVLVGGSLR